MSLRQAIREALDSIGYGPALAELATLRAQLEDERGQLRAISSRIGYFDRINVFHDTADELRERALSKQASLHEAQLQQWTKKQDAALEELLQRYPAFRLLRRLEDWLPIGLRALAPGLSAGSGSLASQRQQGFLNLAAEELGKIEAELRSVYTQDAELLGVVWDLLDPETCRRQAIRDVLAEPHPELGWKAQDGNNLRSILAPGLLEDPAYATLQELPRVADFDDNFCHWLAILFRHLEAFPPLRLILALRQLRFLLQSCSSSCESRLLADGRVQGAPVASLAPVAVSQLDRALRIAAEVFPDVPFFQEVTAWFDPAARTLEAVPPAGEETALQRGLQEICALTVVLEDARGRVSWLDRLNVFSESSTELRERRVKEALDRRLKLWQGRWEQDLLQAQEARGQDSRRRLSDCAVLALTALDSVRTRSGESSSRLECPLYHQQEAHLAWHDLRAALRGEADWPDRFEELLAQAGGEKPAGTLGALLAARLEEEEGQPFGAVWNRLRNLQKEARQSLSEQKQAEGRVSLWDKLNVFTTSARESDAHRAKARTRSVANSADGELERVSLLAREVLQDQPDALLFYASRPLQDMVDDLRAVCGSRTRSTTVGGKTRTETIYYCYVAGHTEAVKAGRDFGALVHRRCGDVPGLLGGMLVDALRTARHPLLRRTDGPTTA